MKVQSHATYTWTVSSIKDETPSVRSFILETDNPRPLFISGQYLTVQLPGFAPLEGKSYSISSSELETPVRLTIKKFGAFSNKLYELQEGDTITTSAPYGFFYPEDNALHDLVFLAGGIGITPCISIIETLCRKNFKGNIFLFYSNQTQKDIVFKATLDALNEKYRNIQVHYYVTREPVPDTQITARRIQACDITEKTQHPHTSEYFICGSIDFTKSMWQQLRTIGIQNSQLYTEGFY